MNELIKVNYDNDRPTVLARDLYEFLEVKTAFKDWFPRMCEYGFSEGVDYCSFLSDRVDGLPGKPRTDAQLTIEMAKEICMLQRNEKGKQARQYFINLEKAWNTPDMIMSRALKMAEKQLSSLKLVNAELTVQNQIMQPKADYFDELVDRNLLTNFRETAKQLGVKEHDFVSFLLDKSTSTGTSAVSSCRMRIKTTACLRSKSASTKKPTGAGHRRLSLQRAARHSGCCT